MNRLDFRPGERFAVAMDERDPLKDFRDRFCFPDAADGGCIYFCGHSLGLQPKTVRRYVEEELDAWARLGVEAHFRATHPWMPYHRLLTEQTAELVGANPLEVVVMNSLTVNLHLMMVSFYQPTPARHKILVERGAFPSDQYAVKSQIRYHGFDAGSALIELSPRAGESSIREEDVDEIIRARGDEIALILMGGVNYATGQAFDLQRIVRWARERGCAVGYDLAHAAGNLQLKLHEWAPDFAAWCSYKYLNGGPGCVGGCFVHERHAAAGKLPRFAGWWGHNERTRFAMGPDFQAMPGAEGWQLSNPSILSMAALRASMEIFHEAGMERLRAKSVTLTAYLEYLLTLQKSAEFTIVTPSEPERRGAQLSVRIPHNGRRLCEDLARAGIFGDWREPDLVRVAPVPLYNSFRDVFHFVQNFFEALNRK